MSALDGLRVVDLATHIAGPYCAKLLADAGADVVKVERQGTGDGARRLGPFPDDVEDPERSGLFLFLNTSKRGITADLATREGQDQVRTLAADADVVVESFRPGTLGRWGLDAAALRHGNSRLVITSVSSFGGTGPHRDLAATELVLNAMGGLTYLNGEYDREPLTLGLHQAQLRAGAYAAVATLAAVRLARTSGRGSDVDVSIMECLVTGLMARLAEYCYRGVVLRRQPRSGPGLSEAQPIAAREGYVVPGLSMPPFGSWSEFVAFIGDPGLAEPRFEDPRERLARAAEINQRLAEAFAERERYEVFTAAQERHFPFGVVQDAGDLLRCPHLAARSFFTTLEHPRAGRLRYPGAPFRTTSGSGEPRFAAPLLGQHDAEVRAAGGAWRAPRHTALREPAPAALAPGPLAGIRVLEAAIQVSVPTIGRALAALGAEVLKVEGPSRPCGLRFAGPYPEGEPGRRHWDRSGYFNEINCGKGGLALDLSIADGQSIFKRLVLQSDVVMENFTPRVMRKFGLDWPALREIKPDLVMLSCTGFGHTGPWRDYVAYGMNVEALNGAASVTGYEGGPPVRSGAAYIDDIVAMHGTVALLAALEERDRTGAGEWIDLAMYEAGMLIPEAILGQQLRGRAPERIGNAHVRFAPHGLYPCVGDDRWIAIAVTSDDEWIGLCAAIGADDLRADISLASEAGRRAARSRIDERIARWTEVRDTDEASAALWAHRIAAGPVRTNADLLRDAQLRARAFFETIDHRDSDSPPIGARPYPGMPFRISGARVSYGRPAPGLGEQNEDVLREWLGMDRAEVAALEARGVIGREPVGRAVGPPRVSSPTDLVAQGRILRWEPDYRRSLPR